MQSSTFTLAFVTSLSCTIVAAGCAAESGDDGATRVAGAARYRDAATAHDGTAREPSAPPAQTMTVEVTVRGTGDLPEIDPACALDPAGEFRAIYAGEASLDDGGVYVASLGEAAGRIETPSGCAIPDLDAAVVTDVVIRAELAATTATCESYCAASARADAEAECGASATAAACRAEAEAEAQAACTTTCTTETRAIVAEATLGASALGELDADALRAAALGELHVDLTFDRTE